MTNTTRGNLIIGTILLFFAGIFVFCNVTDWPTSTTDFPIGTSFKSVSCVQLWERKYMVPNRYFIQTLDDVTVTAKTSRTYTFTNKQFGNIIISKQCGAIVIND